MRSRRRRGQLTVGEAAELDVAEVDPARRKRVEPGEAVHQRALAGARRSHHGGEATGGEADGDVVEGDGRRSVLGPVDLDGRLGAGGERRPGRPTWAAPRAWEGASVSMPPEHEGRARRRRWSPPVSRPGGYPYRPSSSGRPSSRRGSVPHHALRCAGYSDAIWRRVACERCGVKFDIEDYKGRTDRLRWDDLDFGAFRDQPLDDDTLRAIEYMHDVELHTICYLRDLLVTPAHADPDVTTFLSCWAYEELWHGEALGDVLAAHGRRRAPSGSAAAHPARSARPHPALRVGARVGARRGAAARRAHDVGRGQRVDDPGRLRPPRPAGEPPGAHRADRAHRPPGRPAHRLLRSEARRRLVDSEPARRVVRWALRRLWRPVGSGIMPAAETDFVIHHLYGGPDGRAVRRAHRPAHRRPPRAGGACVWWPARWPGGAA